MIREIIVTSQGNGEYVHLAPMGVHETADGVLIMPFRPSTTLDNLVLNRYAVINYTDDVRVFAGCLTGRRDWPLKKAEHVKGHYLAGTLSHAEVEVIRFEDDALRPRFHCKVLHQVNHAPFRGFNRAQFSVIEAAILISRLHMLPWEKIESELTYLAIGLEKTAGEAEKEAWEWIMEAVEAHKHKLRPKAEYV